MPEFQSTLPMRGATAAARCLLLNEKFQSTLPMRGATFCSWGGVLRLVISIHAPHAGSDFGMYSAFLPLSQFQSTLPMRGATIRWAWLYRLSKISIHAPHAGSDDEPFQFLQWCFISIHAPHAGSDI